MLQKDVPMGKAKKRKQYTREFKLEAVKQIVQGDRSLAEVADSLGVNRSVLGRWKTEFLAEGAVAFPGKGAQTPENAEISRLKRELSQSSPGRPPGSGVPGRLGPGSSRRGLGSVQVQGGLVVALVHG